MQKITPCLWFDYQAEEAVKFYTSIFKSSRVNKVTHYTEAGPGEKGQVLTISFDLNGQEFVALNGGPQFKFTEAVSFVVKCETQAEIDEMWEKLSAGGQKSQCGWLKDRYGLSWQIVPPLLLELIADKDRAKADRVMKAMLQMTKIDVAAIKRAAQGS